MISPKVEEDTMLAQRRAERGSKTAEGKKSSISGFFSLLIEMRVEMKRRDE